MITDEDVEDFLEHHGVKGQKWGVRRQRRLNRLADAAKPGSTAAKIRAVSQLAGLSTATGGIGLGPIDLIRGRGITGGANRKVKRVSAREKRFSAGKATTGDLVKHYASTHVSDLVPVKPGNANKKNILDNHKVVVAAIGAAFVVKMLTKKAG